MGLTRFGKVTLTLVVLALLGYWAYTHPEALEGLRAPRLPRVWPPSVPPGPAVRPPEETPQPAATGPATSAPRTGGDGPSLRQLAREQYRSGDYAAAIATLGRAVTLEPFDIEALTLRENAFARLPGKRVWAIAVAGPFSGPDKQCGQQVLFGVYFAQRELNQAGGVAGRKLVVNAYDDQADAEQAVRVATEIIGDDEVLAVVGHCNSRATLSAGPIYNSAALPMITATSTNPEIAQLGEYIFRVVGDDNAQAQAIANAVWDEGHRTVLTFVDAQDAYSRGLAENFRRRFERRGGRVIENAFTIGEEVNVSADPREADAILVAGEYADAGRIARQLRDIGIQAPIVGGDAVYSQGLFAFAGEAARGVRATAFYHYTVRGSSLLPRAEEFARRFESVIHAPPNHNMATAYDATVLILNGLRSGASTREAIRPHLAAVGRSSPAHVGVTGKIAFDADGEVVGKPWVLVRARERDFVADRVTVP
jgi:branched-chain amino acid transport system substrate-binding protein